MLSSLVNVQQGLEAASSKQLVSRQPFHTIPQFGDFGSPWPILYGAFGFLGMTVDMASSSLLVERRVNPYDKPLGYEYRDIIEFNRAPCQWESLQ